MTQKDRIIAAACEGKRPTLIARDLDAALTTVYSVISAARRNGYHIPHFHTGPIAPGGTAAPRQEIRFHLDPDTGATLAAEASARGLPPSRLARQLVTLIAEDALFGALLDD